MKAVSADYMSSLGSVTADQEIIFDPLTGIVISTTPLGI
jgi:hypothetical protein